MGQYYVNNADLGFFTTIDAPQDYGRSRRPFWNNEIHTTQPKTNAKDILRYMFDNFVPR